MELERLLSQLHDGLAGRAELDRIAALLEGDPDACEFYLDYTEMVASMDQELSAGQLIDISADAGNTVPLSIARTTSQFYHGQPTTPLHQHPTTREILNPSWRPLPWFAAAAALMLFAGSLAIFFGKKSPIGPTEVQAQEAPSTHDGVAILMETVNARLDEDSMLPRSGGILAKGEFKLEAGIVEIEFYSGARVIVEGPACLHIGSESGGHLSEGRLRVQVPPQAAGFTVTTPQLEVVDQSGEFGVSIEDDGHLTEVHCFNGSLDVFEAFSNRAPNTLRKLAANEGLRLDPGGIQGIEADTMSFVSYADMAQTSLENASMRHERWQELIEKMRADESILALFSFEEQGPRERTLVNQAAYREQASHGAIVGCRWTNGRWPSKGALEFNRASDRVRVNGSADAAHPVVTFSAWIRLDSLPRRGSTLLASSEQEPGAAEWVVSRDGKLLLIVHRGEGKGRNVYPSDSLFRNSEVGKWHHVATIYDTDSARVTHYLNGLQVSERPIRPGTGIPITLRQAEIGNFGGRAPNGGRPIRHLTGRIDEFALFGRALDGNQLAEMVQVGQPN